MAVDLVVNKIVYYDPEHTVGVHSHLQACRGNNHHDNLSSVSSAHARALYVLFSNLYKMEIINCSTNQVNSRLYSKYLCAKENPQVIELAPLVEQRGLAIRR